MAKVTVGQFTTYDILKGQSVIAREWGTQDAISRLARDNKSLGVTPTERSAEIDEALLDPRNPGFTKRDFVPARLV